MIMLIFIVIFVVIAIINVMVKVIENMGINNAISVLQLSSSLLLTLQLAIIDLTN